MTHRVRRPQTVTGQPRPSSPDASGDGLTPHERVVRAHAWVLEHWPTSLRRRVAVVAVLVVAVVEATLLLIRVVGGAIDAGLFSYVGLAVVCWVGAGGALVPVPGVRPLSWVMIVNQGAVASAPVVVVVAALAMSLGQSSYFLATHVGAHHHPHLRHRHPDREPPTATGPDATADPEGTASPSQRPTGVMRPLRAWLSGAEASVSSRMERHPRRIIFAVSVLPNPLTTFATVTAASTGVPFRHFFVASVAGFLVLTIVLVAAGQAILTALGMM